MLSNPPTATDWAQIVIALATLAAAMAAGKSYFNIHTSVVGGGEIRGFLVPGPEPGSCLR